jgi:elongation factor P
VATVATNDLENGVVLDLDGQLWTVIWFQHHKPGKGNTVVRTKLKHVLTGKVVDRTFNSGLQIQVPLFIGNGEKVEVDTRDGSYLGRV